MTLSAGTHMGVHGRLAIRLGNVAGKIQHLDLLGDVNRAVFLRPDRTMPR